MNNQRKNTTTIKIIKGMDLDTTEIMENKEEDTIEDMNQGITIKDKSMGDRIGTIREKMITHNPETTEIMITKEKIIRKKEATITEIMTEKSIKEEDSIEEDIKINRVIFKDKETIKNKEDIKREVIINIKENIKINKEEKIKRDREEITTEEEEVITIRKDLAMNNMEMRDRNIRNLEDKNKITTTVVIKNDIDK